MTAPVLDPGKVDSGLSAVAGRAVALIPRLHGCADLGLVAPADREARQRA